MYVSSKFYQSTKEKKTNYPIFFQYQKDLFRILPMHFMQENMGTSHPYRVIFFSENFSCQIHDSIKMFYVLIRADVMNIDNFHKNYSNKIYEK